MTRNKQGVGGRPTQETYLWRGKVNQWRCIRDVLRNPREGSEWYRYVAEDGSPGELPIVEPWKCPCHNGRMAMEIMRRNPDIDI